MCAVYMQRLACMNSQAVSMLFPETAGSHPLYRTLCRPYHACLVGSVRATERWELLSHEQNVVRWYCMQLYTFILPVHNIYIV